MEERRYLLPDGGGNSKLSSKAIKMERDTAVRAVRKQPGDPETSTQIRGRKDDLCDVPCKVPRFQYVDFPSLHQCIQQLSVPPLNSWVGSCSLTKAPNRRPISPKENVPKFKYVDYPSLHHCIQQLSVPPLESWSTGLVRHNAEERPVGSEVQKMPSQSGTVRNNQTAKGNEAEVQNKEDSSKVTACSFSDPAKLRYTHTKSIIGPVGGLKKDCTSDGKRLTEKVDLRFSAVKSEFDSGSDYDSRLESGSGSQTDTMVVRNHRPSVISMVHTNKKKHRTPEEHWNPPNPVDWLQWNILPEPVCPFCQQMFTNPEQFRAHQRSHRDKRPN
ncbi:uncharacterized protein si:ch211-284e13.6 [Triplophysa dalaica]|uniref:uncharacterized protein si:ch211-284e13.6 n=1 Tax=Triplophysa dalaica TaxID=1582913 RepID=UPI0024E00825|nr:uncharacterized protein si:ch211-284e13.6 [Triplophysa dalaica]XP_056602256.1 uncharacterized protein si:ch211-284e13.6 [Triplophysa dalaica]